MVGPPNPPLKGLPEEAAFKIIPKTRTTPVKAVEVPSRTSYTERSSGAQGF